MKHYHILISGAVQGVGFRPFIYNLAREFLINGYVVNTPAGVKIEAEADESVLQSFIKKITNLPPTNSYIQSLEYQSFRIIGYDSFCIKDSELNASSSALLLPDISTCPECLKELLDKSDRRYRYPFINCTHCGPRYSIIRSLPYDRSNTSMAGFKMCALCEDEYNSPDNRRFHAQPNACPKCGPFISLVNKKNKVLSTGDDALLKTIELIRGGYIIAIKGLGGFHLVSDASNDIAVNLLRERKKRTHKPFALMFQSLTDIERSCFLSEKEKNLITSPSTPIVLLKRKSGSYKYISKTVAPGNPYLGVMLPYTPLHHLIMSGLKMPIVATSGNISEEPICTNENNAIDILNNIADYFLIHNRPIVRPVDDSLSRIIDEMPVIIRRARGYAPLPIHYIKSDKHKKNKSILAVGGHLKNTITLLTNGNCFTSPHIGDLTSSSSFEVFSDTIRGFTNMYSSDPDLIVSDAHPDYISSHFAMDSNKPVIKIQHHFAHIAACIAENELVDDEVLGVSWDGTGYGLDRTLWGGEFLLASLKSYTRFGYFERFQIPGGEKAVQEPRRSALGLLYKIFKDKYLDYQTLPSFASFNKNEISVLTQMLKKCIQTPWTSSIGRLFDALSSILGVEQVSTYEGHAATSLEFLAEKSNTEETYPFEFKWVANLPDRYEDGIDPFFHPPDKCLQVIISPMIIKVIEDLHNRVKIEDISARFHNTLAEIILEISKRSHKDKIVLSGGCFQNKYLVEKSIKKLKSEGFDVYIHHLVPSNDGCISFGQAVIADYNYC